MVDFSFIGKDAFVIQYEDLISLIGYNHVMWLAEQEEQRDQARLDEKYGQYCHFAAYKFPYTKEDVMRAYLDRDKFDISGFVKQFMPNDHAIELIMARSAGPNLSYAFKMFNAAYQNGIQQLYIHSNVYSKIIEILVSNLEIPVKYVHGDIIPVLRSLPNCTYTTSDPNNIRKCVDVGAPFALTIVDDFPYIREILEDQKLLQQLQDRNVYVQYTGVLSAGLL